MVDSAKDTSIKKLSFHGQAGEYFGIWFVNNTLTWLTLGIYSAWAKVRNMQYFYANTQLDGAHFQFTANPLKILRGRIIAFVLLILYFAAENIDSWLANVVYGSFLLGFFLLMPILSVYTLSFKFRYSQWKGIHFHVKKDFKGAYSIYLQPILCLALVIFAFYVPTALLDEGGGLTESEQQIQSDLVHDQNQQPDHDAGPHSIGDPVESSEIGSDAQFVGEESLPDLLDDEDDQQLEETQTPWLYFTPALFLSAVFVVLIPYFDFISIRYLVNIVMFGQSRFSFQGSLVNYYKMYGVPLLCVFGLIASWLLQWFGVIDWVFILIVATLFTSLYIVAYLKSARYNYALGSVLIDNKHTLFARTKALPTLWLTVSNSIVIALSFGLMRPWAKVRTTRYFVNLTAVVVAGDFDDILNQMLEQSNALAEEVADLFDIEFLE